MHIKTILHFIFITIMLFFFTTSTALAFPTQTIAATNQKLGGLNLDGYCQNLGSGANAVVTNQVWTCGNGGTVIVLTSACQWQYRINNVSAQQDIPGNPYSWSCYESSVTPTPTPQSSLGGLNLNAYCASLGNQSQATTANGAWYCVGSSQAIVLTSACQWQYKANNVTAVQGIPNNVYSWSCYATSAAISPSPIATPSATPTPTPPIINLSGIHVFGNMLVNDQGQQVILRGVNRSGTEYACVQGNGIFDGPNDNASIQAMKTWGINAVNILLNEDCWLGINGVNPLYSGTNYQQAIIAYTKLLESNGIYPILSYHWGAPGTQLALGQPDMPDADHAPAFWQSVANTFKNDQAVILHPQEEPHPLGNTDSQAAWQCWRDGGTCADTAYQVVGMQSLVNTIRSAGANNVIGLSGIQYANTMTQFLNYLPNDPLHNLIGMVDVYPDENPCNTVSCYNSEYAPVIAQMPFMAGEFGESVNGNICGVTSSNIFLNWMDQHNSGYLAWTWDAWNTPCGDLSLITSYDGTPHVPNGTNYKAHLLALGNGLQGEYFDNLTLTEPSVLTRIDPTIDFLWQNSPPSPSVNQTDFSVRWTGYVVPAFSENYTFYTISDDGIRVWVNGVEIINDWTDHSARQDSGSIPLTAGAKTSIRIEYYQHGGQALATLSWSSPSTPMQIIPQSVLFSQ